MSFHLATDIIHNEGIPAMTICVRGNFTLKYTTQGRNEEKIVR